MPKGYTIDYDKLENQISKRSYKLSDVKNQIEKIAFDLCRFRDTDKGSDLWQIQSSDDGDYIVALYETEDKVASSWEVALNKTAGQLQVSYKGDPIVKVACSKLGIPNNEWNNITEYLPAKLSENKKLVKALLNELPSTSKKEIYNRYPELV